MCGWVDAVLRNNAPLGTDDSTTDRTDGSCATPVPSILSTRLASQADSGPAAAELLQRAEKAEAAARAAEAAASGLRAELALTKDALVEAKQRAEVGGRHATLTSLYLAMIPTMLRAVPLRCELLACFSIHGVAWSQVRVRASAQEAQSAMEASRAELEALVAQSRGGALANEERMQEQMQVRPWHVVSGPGQARRAWVWVRY